MSIFTQPLCFQTATPLPVGINFHLAPNRQIFIAYAWLLSVELIDDAELVLSFNSAKIRVIGENLTSIYQAAMKANLSLIIPQRRESDPRQPWVSKIVLESDTQNMAEQSPPYPRETVRM